MCSSEKRVNRTNIIFYLACMCTHISNYSLYKVHSKLKPKRADDRQTWDKKMHYNNKTFFVSTHSTVHTIIRALYLFFPAHHRKPHVAVASSALSRPVHTGTYRLGHARLKCAHLFLSKRQFNLLTCTDKYETSQLHLQGVIHPAERLKSLFTAGNVRQNLSVNSYVCGKKERRSF